MTDGEVFNGFAHDYIAAEDNEPYSESISIDNIELFANEIKSIELLWVPQARNEKSTRFAF